ncbi:hypothetical protein ACSBR1_018491 [Camellia fascicularis]
MSLHCWSFFELAISFNGLIFFTANAREISHQNPLSPSSCSLNFDVLRKLANVRSAFVDVPTRCHYVLQGMRLLRSHYLRTHNLFLPSSLSSQSCWVSYRSLISELIHGFDIESSYGYKQEWISHACMNVTVRSQFERLISESKLLDVRNHYGSEVAVKRFKNCSVGGDRTFVHEVEIVASVTHINRVTSRGYCTATDPLQGHQRMIVYDLMHNGSLYDHLFGSKLKRLSWPIRQKIALRTARGLACLHYESQPTIMHWDIKASNILLDEKFEPKLADFGLEKFNPKELTHLSTKVAGTLGYVAPEYALYGKLTQGSDVYSFGVVLLEILSGKKSVLLKDEWKTCLLTDWARSLVRKGRALEVIEENMPEPELPEVMEQYVLLAVLSCHPHLQARPNMEQIVKLLETNVAVPSGVQIASPQTNCR